MQRLIRYPVYVLLGVIWMLATLPAIAQEPIAGQPLIALNPYRKAVVQPLFTPKYFAGFPFKTFIPAFPTRIDGPAPIKPAFSPTDLAFFCRLEYKMEKALKFPVRIRLGEVQYVEEMEGKINSMRINPARREDGLR